MAFGDARYAGPVRAVRKLAKRFRCDCVWNALLFVEIFQFNHINNGARNRFARSTRLLNFNLISRAELSNGDVEAVALLRSDRHL